MKLKIITILLSVFFLTFVADASEIVKIGLLDDIQQVNISTESGMRVIVREDLEFRLSTNKSYIFKKEGDLIEFARKFYQESRVIIYPIVDNELIGVNGRLYRGYIEIVNNPKGLTVINHVDLDNYLASVVGSEIRSSWPMETLKAQAVVARTYALRNLRSHLSKGYNLSATVRSQSYKGVTFETLRTVQAVKETDNKVLTYNNRLISAVYHSSAGGRTAKGATIWNSDTPYLQSVDSPDNLSPHYMWQKEYSKQEIESILGSKGVMLKSLKKITLEGRGPSGRAKFIRVHDENRQYYDIDSSNFRFWLGLRSTRFKIKENISKRLYLDEYRGQYLSKFNNLKLGNGFIKEEIEGYLFIGNGWGHGVGMSQWGAYQLALQGYTYDQILTHYYQGVEISTVKINTK